jgi:hypothetical protein
MMSTPTTVSAVQESTKCIEGLHMMHVQHARLVCVGIEHHLLDSELNLGDQNPSESAPNQLD